MKKSLHHLLLIAVDSMIKTTKTKTSPSTTMTKTKAIIITVGTITTIIITITNDHDVVRRQLLNPRHRNPQ